LRIYPKQRKRTGPRRTGEDSCRAITRERRKRTVQGGKPFHERGEERSKNGNPDREGKKLITKENHRNGRQNNKKNGGGTSLEGAIKPCTGPQKIKSETTIMAGCLPEVERYFQAESCTHKGPEIHGQISKQTKVKTPDMSNPPYQGKKTKNNPLKRALALASASEGGKEGGGGGQRSVWGPGRFTEDMKI